MTDDTKVTRVFRSYMTPSGYKQPARVEKGVCDQKVPLAADSMLGKCEYYYQPLGCGTPETVEKVSMSSIVEATKAFVSDPWADKELIHRLLHRREQLIAPNCTDSDWSRHSSFIIRHIGCGHKPPGYYVSYGYYYCSTYGAELSPKLSPKGQLWLKSARWLLQKNMERGLDQNMRKNVIRLRSEKYADVKFTMDVPQYQLELDDKIFTTFAFKTHPLAYLDGGLAYLSNDDLLTITRQPNIEEWGDKRTWEQAYDSAKVVIPQKIDDFKNEVSDLVGKALSFLMRK